MKKKCKPSNPVRIRLLKTLLTMKFLCFLFLLSISASATTFSQDAKLTLSMEDVALTDVFLSIREKSDFSFIYNTDDLRDIRLKSVRVKDASIQEVLDIVLKRSGFIYKIENNVVVIHPNVSNDEKKKVIIKGYVYDENKNPFPGVTVKLKGVSLGTVSNSKGWFSIELPVEKGILEFSFIGYKLKQLPFSHETGQVKVFMETDMQQVDEVVVTGIFNKAKESFTGAATLITKEQLMEFKSPTLLKTLANIDPSFNVIQNNDIGSDPNKLPEINIRGTTSIPSNIEDLQAGERANLNTPLFILDGFEISLERMMDLDPEEIESVTLLKDASSTAIYGSRGSNGVVVLSSVKPKQGQLRVNVSGSTNFEIPDLSSYSLLNAREKLEIERIAGFYIGENVQEELRFRDLYSKKLRAVEEGVNTYWLDKPLHTGVGQNYRLNMSGGDSSFRYSMSASYNNLVAVMKGSYRNNFNGSLNISYYKNKIKITNVVSVGVNGSSNSKYGEFREYTRLNPYWELYDENGDMYKKFGRGDLVIGEVNNPLYASLLDSKDERTYTSIRNNTNVEWEPYEGIRLGLRAGISQQISESDKFTPPNHVEFEDEDDVRKKGEYLYSNSKSLVWNMDMTFSYAKVIDKHTFFVGFNGSIRESQSRGYSVSVQGFTHDQLDFISMGSQYKGDVPGGSETTVRSVGITGNVNYNYKQMLYVDGSYRLDGASSFGEHGRFKPYYSGGVGWTASRLKFFQDYLSSISTLRFRYSYGVTGSLQFTNPYQAMTVYKYSISSRYNGYIGATIMGYGNQDLSWQYTYSHNLGMDLSLLRGKVSFGVNVYRRKTEGLTTTMDLPLSHGYDNYTENRGDVENKGIDADISIRIIRKKEFSWSVRAGIAHNRNKILKLSEAMKSLSAKAEEEGTVDPNYLYRVGESMDALYVVPSLGIDPNTGREVFINQRGEPTYEWQPENRRSYGVKQPKVNGRFSSSIRYKGLSLTASFGVRLGGQIYNSTLVSKVESADLKFNVDKRVYSDRWRYPGDWAKYQLLNGKAASKQSSRFVQDESTLEFRSLNLSYNFPREILKRLNLKGGSFTARMNDILYISTVKRERGTSYPFSYKPSFSLSITI